MQRGGLPKGAELPEVKDFKYDEEQVKENAKLRVDKKGQSYTQPLVISILFRKKRRTKLRSR